MEITLPLYSVLSKILKTILPGKAVALIAIVLFSFTYTSVDGQDATNIAITSGTSSPSCSNVGVQLTATVTDVPTPASTPTGSVQFLVDGVNSGGPVTLAGGTATFTTPLLTAGPHNI